MSDIVPVLKSEVQKREAILITALQDYFGAQNRYVQTLENLANVNVKVESKEVEKKDAKKKSSVHE